MNANALCMRMYIWYVFTKIPTWQTKGNISTYVWSVCIFVDKYAKINSFDEK